MSFFRKLKDAMHHDHSSDSDSAQQPQSGGSAAPPQWAPAPEVSHQYGLKAEAPEAEYESAERYCRENPPFPPMLLPSELVDKVNSQGCKAWGIEVPTTYRFMGVIHNPTDSKGGPGVVKVETRSGCLDSCLLSDMPLMACLYDIQGKEGVYYEVMINRMDGFIAIGTSCRPYPNWRLPGWNRLSAGLHLDDFRKFFEDPDGGRDYTTAITRISPGDTIGCGYEFSSSSLFFTYNGLRLPTAFKGIYVPRQAYDVFAAIGVEGVNEFEVNFGGEPFRWLEGNEWTWRVEGHVGRLNGAGPSFDNELPSYSK